MKFFFIFYLTFILSCAPSLDTFYINDEDDPLEDVILSEKHRPVSDLLIVAIDVGQGDSTLVMTPSGQNFLIDTGPAESGKNSILPLMRQMGVTSLDAIFITHYDADHIGGFSEVLAGFDEVIGTDDDMIPDIIYDRGNTPFYITSYFETYLSLAESLRSAPEPGNTWETNDGVVFTCMIVDGKTQTSSLTLPNSDDNENERSLGLLIEYNGFRYFTSGDLTGGGPSGSRVTEDLESMVAPLVGKVDVLHINHHGSLTSSNPTFLETLSPTASIISTGNHNTYGHPSSEILSRLYQIGSEVYLTEKGNGGYLPTSTIADGSIFIFVDAEGNYTINGE